MKSRIAYWLETFLDEAHENNYKRGWVWYKMQETFDRFTLEELFEIAFALGYKSAWATIQFAKQAERNAAPAKRYASDADSRLAYLRQELDLLELNPPFTQSELKQAYRRKSKTHHPDTGGSHESFLKLQSAFYILAEAIA